MFLSFVLGADSICPEAMLNYAPWGWVGELHVVHDPHLLGLQIYAGSFETCWLGEMTCHFSQVA
jgi:hypothetical protein